MDISVIAALTGLLVGAITGAFAAGYKTRGQLADVHQTLAVLSTQLDSLVTQNAEQAHEKRIRGMEEWRATLRGLCPTLRGDPTCDSGES